MNKTLMTQMKVSISEVFETMFFLPVEFVEKPDLSQYKLDDSGLNAACSLKFSGDVSGRIILAVPKSFVLLMAQNFMGESEENILNEHLAGTLTETANMIAGNALKKVESKVPFELNIPEMMDTIKGLDQKNFTLIQTPDAVLAFGLILDSA